MRLTVAKLAEIIQSLMPKDQEELSLLGVILECVQEGRPRGTPLSSALNFSNQSGSFQIVSEVKSLLESIPEDARRYLHGLGEALEVFQSIHGRRLAVTSLVPSDPLLRELRQIRDLCLEDGLKSIY